jgi:uncharacterized protein involved in outer membrane biogenesis
MKKVAIVFAIFLILVVGTVLALPFIVNVDKYRPQIIQAANQRLNGTLELGQLKLSLWGQVRVDIGGLAIKDQQGASVLAVKDAYLHVPFLPVLQGSPIVTLKMNQPNVTVVKGVDGTINVMKLLKESPPEAAQAPTDQQAAQAAQGAVAVPGMLARAKAGAELRSSQVLYRDVSTGLESRISDFNLVLKDISLTNPTSIEAWADLKTTLGKTLSLEGPFRFQATATPSIVAGRFDGLSLSAKALFDEVQVSMPGTFEKPKGIPAHAEFSGSMSSREVKLSKFVVRFFNAEVQASGSLTNMAAPIAKVEFKSNSIQLKPWADLIPMLKGYDLDGRLNFEGSADGPTTQLQYRAQAKFDQVVAKAPYMKVKPRIDGSMSVVTDQVENLTLAMKAPGSDVLLRGKVVSFTTPQVNIELTSTSLDLDQLLDMPVKADAPVDVAGAPGKGAESKAAAEPDLDSMLAPLRALPIVALTTSKVSASIKSMKYYGAEMNDLTAAMSTKGFTANLSKLTMKVWEGAVHANAEVNLKPQAPTYGFSAKVTGLDLKKAAQSQMTLFKNSIVGRANFSMDGNGASFNTTLAKQNLKGRGNMRVEKATFATIDIGKLASEALTQAIDRVSSKYPALKGKKVGMPPGRESRYEFISSDFTIAEGRFKAPNFTAVAEKNQGVDLKGSTEVGMIDYSLAAKWVVVDSYNLTQAADVELDVAGTNITRVLAPGNEPVQFPVTVGCKITSPCYSYTEVPEYFAGVVLKNATRAAEGRAKAELQNRASDLIKKAPPAVQQGLEGLKKKLFR